MSLLSHFHVRNTSESITVKLGIHTAVPQKLKLKVYCGYNPYYSHAGFQVLVTVTEDHWLLGCEAMFFGTNLLFQSSMLPPSSGWKHTLKLKTAGSSVLLASFFQSTWRCFPNDDALII